MTWKILSVASSVILMAVAYFGWENRSVIKQKQAALASERESLLARETNLQDVSDSIVEVQQSIRLLDDEIEKLKVEDIDVEHQIVSAKAELRTLENGITKAKAKFEASDIYDFDEVKTIQTEIKEAQFAIGDAEIEMVKLEGIRADFETRQTQLEGATAALEELRGNQDSGVITGSFESTVIMASGGLGFVVIGAGNDQGVVLHAKLDVLRRGQPIARLLVTEVSPELCVADIVADTLMPGQRVQIDDFVRQAN